MIKIVHCGDVHMGISFSSISVEKQKEAIYIHMNVFNDVINRANDIGADILIISGDLFDNPSCKASIASDVIAMLAKARCYVFISPGNHDYFHFGSPYNVLTMPENVHVFRENSIEKVYLDDINTVVYGAAFTARHADIDIVHPEGLDKDKINICVVHSDIECNSKYNYLPEAKIRESGYDYIAVGHNHEFSTIRKSGNTYYACPGALMGMGFDEMGVKGYIVGDIDKDYVSLNHVDARGIQFIELEVDVSDILNDNELVLALSKITPPYHARCVSLIRLIGKRNYNPDIYSLNLMLNEAFFGFVIRDNTESAMDIWMHLEEDSLRGEYTRTFKQRLDFCTCDNQEKLLLKALEYGLLALEGQDIKRDSAFK